MPPPPQLILGCGHVCARVRVYGLYLAQRLGVECRNLPRGLFVFYPNGETSGPNLQMSPNQDPPIPRFEWAVS